MPERIYLDHNATTPSTPEVREAMLPFLAGGLRQPLEPPLVRPAGPRGGRGRARARGRPHRRAAGRDRLHQRRHRGRQPGASWRRRGAGPAAGGIVCLRDRAPRRAATPPGLSRAGRRRCAHRPRGRRRASSTSTTSPRTSTAGTALVVGDAGQQRDRRAPAGGRGRARSPARAASLVHVRRGAGRGQGRGRRRGRWACDLLTVSAHKIYGPKGVGALYVRRGTPLRAARPRRRARSANRRAGTENVAGIVGFGVAAELAAREPRAEERRGWLPCATASRRRLLAASPTPCATASGTAAAQHRPTSRSGRGRATPC